MVFIMVMASVKLKLILSMAMGSPLFHMLALLQLVLEVMPIMVMLVTSMVNTSCQIFPEKNLCCHYCCHCYHCHPCYLLFSASITESRNRENQSIKFKLI